jgi:dTMP kinase
LDELRSAATAFKGRYTRLVKPSREVPARGWFITIEGPEGAGKTTQAARLEAYLQGSGVPTIRTREPGGTALGERIRDLLLDPAAHQRPADPLADALLFNAARRQLVEEVIRPGLSAGTTVVCARFADSTLAYQGFGSGLPLDDLRELQSIATGGLMPDLTIVLDLPPEVGLRRKAPDDRTRFELAFDLDFHQRVRDGFLAIAAQEPARVDVINADANPADVWEAIRRSVDRLVGDAAPYDDPERAGQRIHG